MWLSVAIKSGVAVITFAIGVATSLVWTIVRTPSTLREHTFVTNYADEKPGTLRYRIREAKANGDHTVELSVLGCGWAIGSLQEALSRDTVVLADLIGKKTYEDTYGLHTWYRFKIQETLLENPSPRHEYLYGSAPSDMLPIAENEFLIHEVNGQMEIDGVTVIQRSNGARYVEGQTYLLFLWFDPSKQTAIRAGTDPLGVFLVDSNGNLSSYIDQSHPLKTAIAKRFNNSITNMRQALKK